MIEENEEKDNNNNEDKPSKTEYKIERFGEKGPETDDDHPFKVLFLGDIAVGKTALICRAVKNKYLTEIYQPTVGFDLFNYVFKINNDILKVQIWDTCGQEQYSSLTPALFKGTVLIILVYAIDNKNSFENINKWINLVRSKARPDVAVFLVGNKNDLEDTREVTKEEAEELSKTYEFKYFNETSSKKGLNVIELMEKICITIYENFYHEKNIDSGRISIEKEELKTNSEIKKQKMGKEKKGCC